MTQSMNAFLEYLKDTDIGREILAKQATERYAERQALVDRRLALVKKLEAATATHTPQIKRLFAAALDLKTKWLSAEQALRDVQNEQTNNVRAATTLIEEIDRELNASADERIEAAKWAMQGRFDGARHSLLVHETVPGHGFHPHTLRPTVISRSNRDAIDRLCNAIVEARGKLDELKVTNPKDVEAAIAQVLAPVEECWRKIRTLDPLPKA